MTSSTRKSNRYSRKSARPQKLRSHSMTRRRNYHNSRRYPENLVRIEEPSSDDGENSEEPEQVFYNYNDYQNDHDQYYAYDSDGDLDADDEDEEDNVILYYTDDKDMPHAIDMNDELEQQALEEELYTSSAIVDLNDELEERALLQIYNDHHRKDTKNINYNKKVLEAVRREFAQELNSSDNSSSEEENNMGSEPEFYDVHTDMDIDDEEEYDAGDPRNYDFEESSSSSSEDEGETIYKHRFDLHRNDVSESSDEELMGDSEYDQYQDMVASASESDDEDYDSDGYLCAQDLEDETDTENNVTVVDISKDMENLKDCELVEIDDCLYKLTLRLPSLIKDQTRIDFAKDSNELIVRGKIAFLDKDESDVDETVNVESEDDSQCESSSDSDSNDESSDESSDDSNDDSSDDTNDDSSDNSNDDSSDDSNSDSDSDSEKESGSDSDSDEEVIEDTKSHIKEYGNQEISFEKHIQFVKWVKFDQIDASYNRHGELEVIIPCFPDDESKSHALYPISIQGGSPDSDDSSTEEMFED